MLRAQSTAWTQGEMGKLDSKTLSRESGKWDHSNWLGNQNFNTKWRP